MAAGEPPTFVMFGARTAMTEWLPHIAEAVEGIERAVTEQPGLAFDLARTLIESTCRAILTERRIAFDRSDDLSKLFKVTRDCLPLLPPEASGETRVRKSLAQTLSGLHTAVQGVCELRNACGFASHGSQGPRPPMEEVQALLVAGAADAIVGFLHRAHRNERRPSIHPPVDFNDNRKFNEYIDDVHGLVRIFDVDYRPSEILFHVDLDAYRVYRDEFTPEGASEGTREEDPAS